MSGIRNSMRFLGLALVAWALAPGIAAAQQAYESPAAAKLEVTSASAEANKHFWAGVSDAENVFFTSATAHFDKALEADPAFGMARVFRARSAAGMNQAARLAEINKGISELSGATTGELLTALGMREWTAGNLKEAMAIFGTASRMMPGDPHLAMYRANVTGGATNPERGIAAMRSVTEDFPEFAPAWNTLGYQLWQAGDRAGGLEAIKKYAELAPDHPNAHDSYAELLQWSGRYNDAMAHYRRAAELDPTYGAAYTGMAEVSQMMGAGDHARRYLNEAIEHAQGPNAKINLMRGIGASYAIDGNMKAAVEQFTAAAAEAEQAGNKNLAALALHQAAMVEAMAGKKSDATAHLTKAGELMGADNPQQLGFAAMVNARIGNSAAAMESAQKLEEAASKGSAGSKNFSHLVNGVVFLRANQLDKAVAELAQADPNAYATKAFLATCYDKMGQKAEAAALREEVKADRQYGLGDAGYMVARLEVMKK